VDDFLRPADDCRKICFETADAASDTIAKNALRFNHLAIEVRSTLTTTHVRPPTAKTQQRREQAFSWREMLESGEYATIREIVASEKINESYVRRVLRLTLLSPEPVEAILNGRQPAVAVGYVDEEVSGGVRGAAVGDVISLGAEVFERPI
jgi:hypothetical protein